MHKLELNYEMPSLFGKPTARSLKTEMAEKWDELTKKELEYVIAVTFNNHMDLVTKKTLLLQKLGNIPLMVFSMLNEIQIISIYDCLDVFFERPNLTKNLYPKVSFWHYLRRHHLYGPSNAFGNLTVTEFIAAEDYYFDYLTNDQQPESLDGLIATLWRPGVKGLKETSPEYRGDLREPYSRYMAIYREKHVAKIPSIYKIGMLYYYQGCRSLLSELYPELFKNSSGTSSQNADAWLEMLGHLPNDKFGTIDEMGPMNLLTVLYFTNLLIASNKKQKAHVV